jgi:hypothetical protein
MESAYCTSHLFLINVLFYQLDFALDAFLILLAGRQIVHTLISTFLLGRNLFQVQGLGCFDRHVSFVRDYFSLIVFSKCFPPFNVLIRSYYFALVVAEVACGEVVPFAANWHCLPW